MIGDLKPYAAYKDSDVPWLGKVPEHWDVRPLFSTYHSKLVRNLGMIEKTVLSLSYGQIIVKPEEKLHGLVPESFETYQIVDPGNIIIRTTDLQNDKVSLRVGLVKDRGIITSAYLCLQVKQRLLKDYGYLLLNAYDLLKIFYGYGSGLRQNLDFTHIKRMPVLAPPIEEQTAIATFLDYADRRIRRYIRSKQKLIKLLEEEKQVVINEAVTRGLDPNVPMKRSGIEWLGDIPEHWATLQLKRLVSTVTSGSRGWAEFYSDDGDVFIQSGNLGRSMELNLSFIQHVQIPHGTEGIRTKIKRDDILICITGALTGNVVLVDIDLPTAYINQHVALTRPKHQEIFPRYLAYCLHSRTCQSQFKTTEYGGTKQGLSLNDVKSIVVAVPCRSEQESIVSALDEKLDHLRTAIDKTHQEISLFREFRTCLIADVVTGKLDVREAAAKLPVEVDELEALEEDLDEDVIGSEDELDPDAAPEDDAA